MRLIAGITVIVLLLGTVASVGNIFSNPNDTLSFDTDDTDTQQPVIDFPSTEIHWDFPLDVEVCGEEYAFTQQEDPTSIIHGHNDGYIHVEGIVQNREDVTVGKFFESVGLDFGNDHIAEYKSGETVCPGVSTPGTLTVKANDTVLKDPVNYVLDKEHQDIIVTFE